MGQVVRVCRVVRQPGGNLCAEWCMKLGTYTQNFRVSQLVSGKSFQTEIEFEFLDFLI